MAFYTSCLLTLLLHKFSRPSTFHQTSIYIDLYHLSYGHSSPAPGTLLHQLPTQGVVGIGCHAQRTLHFQLRYWCRWKKPILSVNIVDTCTEARGCQERLTIDYAKLESMQIQYMTSIEINVWTSMSCALKSRSLPLNVNILPHLSTKIRQKYQGWKFNMFHLWGRFASSLEVKVFRWWVKPEEKVNAICDFSVVETNSAVLNHFLSALDLLQYLAAQRSLQPQHGISTNYKISWEMHLPILVPPAWPSIQSALHSQTFWPCHGNPVNLK